jgi:hypothetical protein
MSGFSSAQSNSEFGHRRAQMIRIVIRGYAAVFQHSELVTDPAIVQRFAGLEIDGELFTEYLDPPNVRGVSPEEKVLAQTLEPGGIISFGHREGDPVLTATTEYRSPRPLTPDELRALFNYTIGQWGDGIGEGLAQIPDQDGYTFECLWSKEVLEDRCPMVSVGGEYPSVEVIGPPEAMQAWAQFQASRNTSEQAEPGASPDRC